MQFVFRPLPTWPYPEQPHRPATYQATYARTLLDLEALPNFWCHQGIRRPVAYRHPDGRVRPVEDSADYRPPMGKVAPTGEQVPYRADGTPAERCAGWAQVQRFREAHA